MFRLAMSAIGLAVSNNNIVRSDELAHAVGIPAMKAKQMLEQIHMHQSGLRRIYVDVISHDHGTLEIKMPKLHPLRWITQCFLALTRSNIPKHDYDY